MPSNGEYTKPVISGKGCSYTTLQGYNSDYFQSASAVGAPVASQTRSPETIIVPAYGGIAYHTPSEKKPSCSGYQKLQNAYSQYPNACSMFSSQLCRK